MAFIFFGIIERVDGPQINTPSVKSTIYRLLHLPKSYYIAGGALLVVVIILGIFWPHQIAFSYAGKTCFYQPTFAPGLLRSRGDAYRLEAAQKLTVAGTTIAALQMCAIPLDAPKEGERHVSLSLLGVAFLQKTYTIKTPETPTVSAIASKPVSVSRALIIPLSTSDAVFSYKIASGATAADCSHKTVSLSCDIPKLGLKQGSRYILRLERYFGDKKSATVKSYHIETLSATAVVDSSIRAGEYVVTKPKSAELITDKDIASALVKLVRIDGDKRSEIPVKVVHSGKKITVSWDEDLPRQAKYELVANKVIGNDGSGLDGVHTVPFETSGGPKVKSISVGTYKVPTTATATLTFDQPIAPAQDITKAITLSGGATIVGRSTNQVSVGFAGVPRCGDVGITVSDTLQSDYGITGGSSWRYATRTTCQVVGSIGMSVRGRAISSYSFGSGASTVLYTGAIHGSESSTRSLMLRWIDELEANPRSIPVGVTVVVIPSINPDGVAAGTRTNARNVDLNRNFATSDWKSDVTTVTNDPFPGGGGASPLSEPESRAIAQYVAQVKPRLVLSYHSIGGLLVGNQTGDSSLRASAYSRLSGYSNTTGASDTFEYGISGTADDYYGQVLGVPSVLIELGSHTDAQFSKNRSAMWAMLQ